MGKSMKDLTWLKKNAQEYASLLEFPSEACARLADVLDAIARDESSLKEFSRLLTEYDENFDVDHCARVEEMRALSTSVGIDAREGWLVLYLSMLPRLRLYFEEKGIPDERFLAVIPDLRYKLTECTVVEGVYGLMESAVGRWYELLFRCRLFTFARLQFVFQEANFVCECEGVKIEKDTPLLNIHIPRTGGKLDREGVLAAYREAAEYYASAFGDRPIIMTCSSWMLCPRPAEFLAPDSNMMQFYHDFHLVSSGYYDNYASVWRVFDCDYTGDVDALPTNTSLRRAYADRVRRGEPTGSGRGFFRMRDGEIVSRA